VSSSSYCKLGLALFSGCFFSSSPRAGAGENFARSLPNSNLLLIAQFARLDPARLGVIARTSVMPYKKSPCNIAQIGRSLNVDYILEGSVRFAPRQIRIAAQLIDVRDQTHLFADTCARRWTEGVSIQVAFAERIARLVCEHLLTCSSAAV
jgi:TolB-like protein